MSSESRRTLESDKERLLVVDNCSCELVRGDWLQYRRRAGGRSSFEFERTPDIVPRRSSSVPPERTAATRGGRRGNFSSHQSASLMGSSCSGRRCDSGGEGGRVLIPKLRLGRSGTAHWGSSSALRGSIEMKAFPAPPESPIGVGVGDPPDQPLEVLRMYEQAVLDTAEAPAVSESLSEVLLNGSSMGSISRSAGAVGRWRDPGPGPKLPAVVMERLLRYLDHDDYLALRLTCRAWHNSLRAPAKVPSVSYLPPEIIQYIYGFLAPADFNSARHTSRAWLAASLDKSLLLTMLRRGGWLGGVDLGGSLPGVQESDAGSGVRMSEEWWLSKCLSRECSLGPDWRGDGLPWSRSRSNRLSPPGRNRRRGARSTSLEMTSVTDFSEIVSNYTEVEDVPGSSVHFTVSVCGKYVMVAEGCVVYIYRLSGQGCHGVVNEGSLGGCLSPVTSVLCPRRVLAVSMDTSCDRFAIAALLDGRMGLVCDIANSSYEPSIGDATSPGPSGSSSTQQLPFDSTAFGRITDDVFAFTESELAEINELEGSSRIWAAVGGSDPGVRARLSLPRLSPEEHDLETGWPAFATSQAVIPIEAGPSAVYRNVCSTDDPPMSVAICPQRKCVDFLPPRRGVDSAKKLRLISSAAHPGGSAPLSHRFNARRAATSPFWSMCFTPQFSALQSSISDHFRAVPLSDGYHILFIDPATGLLCLGSDAPLGGPTKLLRKIILLGPEGESPTMYASGSDLRWGVRVVVGFGDRVWLFSVPPDVFNDGHGDRLSSRGGNSLWADGWLASDDRDGTVGVALSQGPWPIRLRGAEVGSVQGLVDIAVESGPNMIIWTFCAGGKVFTWQIEGGSGGSIVGVRRRVVLREGGVVDCVA
ncbi:hypothetical protein FGG08_006773 [Glutinoglossum americanum]|uniref:F-box domain-containing protein n=1 Tax=Glutinoglossum americanum TaxID=1670608 RepID=A0A9P8KX44_9PEZI|nr:hypothetical protein FGG08_006773 [Glutinoglossum americanum]